MAEIRQLASGVASAALHAVAVVLLLTGVEPAAGGSCAGCGGFSRPQEQPPSDAYPHEVLRHAWRLGPEPRCPASRGADREASLEPGWSLPTAPLPLILCARVARDGSVTAVRTIDGSPLKGGGDALVKALRRLRFHPATARGRNVASWRTLAIGGDPTPVDIL